MAKSFKPFSVSTSTFANILLAKCLADKIGWKDDGFNIIDKEHWSPIGLKRRLYFPNSQYYRLTNQGEERERPTILLSLPKDKLKFKELLKTINLNKKLPKNVIQLNSCYRAEINKNKKIVIVGCQTFTFKIIKQLYKKIQ
jgi:hypothetical protein